jgi:hypothetical protein
MKKNYVHQRCQRRHLGNFHFLVNETFFVLSILFELYDCSIYFLKSIIQRVGTSNFFLRPQSQFRNLKEKLPQLQFRNF